MSGDDRLTVTVRIEPGGEDAQEILCFAHCLCSENDPLTLMQLVNAVTLAAVQMGQPTEEIARMIEALRPGAEQVAAEILKQERRHFDA